MRNALFLTALVFYFAAFPLRAQTPDMDLYTERFFRGSEPGPQNFVLSSLEDMLVSKAFLLDYEMLTVEINGGSTGPLAKDYGESLHTEFSNYTEKYGRSTCSPDFLSYFAFLRMALVSHRPQFAAAKLSALAREDFDMAIKKDPAHFRSHLGIARWYLKVPVSEGGDPKVAEKYLAKAEAFARKPFEKYQVHVWRAVMYKAAKNSEGADKEIAAAAGIYPSGKFHVFVSNQK